MQTPLAPARDAGPADEEAAEQLIDDAIGAAVDAASSAGEVIAGGVSDVVEDDAEPEQPEQPSEKSFRERTLYEMQQVLGRPVRLLRDAINAAYRAEAWRWRTESTEEQDLRAYARARSWGFHIDELIARGRDQPFRLEDLSGGPLRPRPRRQRRQQTKPSSTAGIATAPAQPQPPPVADSPELTAREVAPAVAKIDSALTGIERRVDVASRQIELSARRLREASRRRAIPREVVDKLLSSTDRLLSESEGSLLVQERQIRALKAAGTAGR